MTDTDLMLKWMSKDDDRSYNILPALRCGCGRVMVESSP